jgi:hypothetical protein
MQQIAYSWTPTNFGGYRMRLSCPNCYRACDALYAGATFACRCCYRLVYQSQYDARRRQQRLPYSDAPREPVPPQRGISKEERGVSYTLLDEALQAVHGYRIVRHPRRHHLIDGMLLGSRMASMMCRSWPKN